MLWIPLNANLPYYGLRVHVLCYGFPLHFKHLRVDCTDSPPQQLDWTRNQLWYGFIKEELLWLIIRSVVKWKGHNVTLTDEPTEECVVWPDQKNASEMCMYSSLREVNKGNPYGIRLVKCSRSDLQWWSCFPPTWNGISNKVS